MMFNPSTVTPEAQGVFCAPEEETRRIEQK
jgi:hypothetical protein